MGGDELKNKTYSEAIQQMIQNGEVEEVSEDPRKSKNMDRTINYLPHHIMGFSNLIAYLLNVALYSTLPPKIQKGLFVE